MSVLIASAETTAKISDMIYRIVKWGYEQERISLSAESIDYIKSIWGAVDSERELRIFEALQALNLSDFNSYYKKSIENESINSPVAEPYSPSRFSRSEGFSIGENRPEDYQKLKSIIFFAYQCERHGKTPDEEKLYKVLCELKNGLFHYIIENSPDYKAAIWG